MGRRAFNKGKASKSVMIDPITEIKQQIIDVTTYNTKFDRLSPALERVGQYVRLHSELFKETLEVTSFNQITADEVITGNIKKALNRILLELSEEDVFYFEKAKYQIDLLSEISKSILMTYELIESIKSKTGTIKTLEEKIITYREGVSKAEEERAKLHDLLEFLDQIENYIIVISNNCPIFPELACNNEEVIKKAENEYNTNKDHIKSDLKGQLEETRMKAEKVVNLIIKARSSIQGMKQEVSELQEEIDSMNNQKIENLSDLEKLSLQILS